MSTVMTVTADSVDVLVERLTKGAELLFSMEQRGDVGAEYTRWFEHWARLLERYESASVSSL